MELSLLKSDWAVDFAACHVPLMRALLLGVLGVQGLGLTITRPSTDPDNPRRAQTPEHLYNLQFRLPQKLESVAPPDSARALVKVVVLFVFSIVLVFMEI